MRFGPVPLDEADGAILAHTMRHAGGTLKKGTVLSAGDIAALRYAGVKSVVAARLEEGDVGEDAAAVRLAKIVAGSGVRLGKAATGRVNLFAEGGGVLVVDAGAVARFNRVDEGITVATLPAYRTVTAGEMVATVKIIPFALPEPSVRAAEVGVPAAGLFAVREFRARPVGVVSTLLPGTSDKMLAKTARILAERLGPSGSAVLDELRVPHDEASVAGALKDLRARGAELLLVYGASAIVDRGDVIPVGIEAAGGEVRHLGMPVDPGNLLLLGSLEGVPVVGAPGCARSPKENGFDWVLHRLLADIPVNGDDLACMGVGGLLMEIESRPQPREGSDDDERVRVGAVILAAGRSRRMGGPNKLLEEIDGKPLVRIAVEAALASRAAPVVVVTGHEADRIAETLHGLDVIIAHNRDYSEGLSTSLRAGIEALPDTVDAALVGLADMPGISAEIIDGLISAFDPTTGKLVVVPTSGGKRGNPVLWSRRFFGALSAICGDVGARHLIGEHTEAVVEVEVGDRAVLTDVDTPQALDRIRRRQPAEG